MKTFIVVVKSFRNFAQTTAVSRTYSAQNLKIICLLIDMYWAKEFTHGLGDQISRAPVYKNDG